MGFSPFIGKHVKNPALTKNLENKWDFIKYTFNYVLGLEYLFFELLGLMIWLKPQRRLIPYYLKLGAIEIKKFTDNCLNTAVGLHFAKKTLLALRRGGGILRWLD